MNRRMRSGKRASNEDQVHFLEGGLSVPDGGRASTRTLVRFTRGLGPSTNLNDQFPWGIWIGFDVLCGVMLAAGGFTLTAAVHIFNIKRLHPIVRPTILTAFLGLRAGVRGAHVRPGAAIPHLAPAGHAESALGDVRGRLLRDAVHHGAVARVLAHRAGTLQSAEAAEDYAGGTDSAGDPGSDSLDPAPVIAGHAVPDHAGKAAPASGTRPLLPVFFFVSAIAVGLAMTIFESSMSSKYFGQQLELPILQELGRVLVVVLSVYGILRFEDLLHRGVLKTALATGL